MPALVKTVLDLRVAGREGMKKQEVVTGQVETAASSTAAPHTGQANGGGGGGWGVEGGMEG